MGIEEDVVKVSGSSYCVAGTDGGEWYMWGNGAMGLFRYPTKMSFLNGADFVSFGINFGVISKRGKV
jgi:hypothetical protein